MSNNQVGKQTVDFSKIVSKRGSVTKDIKSAMELAKHVAEYITGCAKMLQTWIFIYSKWLCCVYFLFEECEIVILFYINQFEINFLHRTMDSKLLHFLF